MFNKEICRTLLLGVFCTVLISSSLAQFVNDEFNGSTLNPQWTFHDSTPAGTTYTLTGNALSISAPVGSDLFHFVDGHGYIEQNAPSGTNWEVVVKIDNWDPTQPGQQRDFIRSGIQLWQDNDHYIFLSLLSNNVGEELGVQALWQTDPNGPTANDDQHWGAIDIFNFGAVPERYLKIQKTAKGYQGFISADGSTWLNCMSIVKNPETSDGYFSNEKIRLFQAGGFEFVAPGGPSPINFDYVRANSIAAPVTGYMDDEFNGSSLGSHWGFHPGIGTGNYGFNNQSLSLYGGNFADLWIAREQVTHVYQDAPSFTNYNITTKVAPTQLASLPFELYNSYGLWLWHDQSNWALISNQRNDNPPGSPINAVEAAFKINGVFTPSKVEFASAELPQYLRFENLSGSIKAQYSFDNVSWSTVNTVAGSTFSINPANLQIRLFNKRAFHDGNPIDAEFDWLRAQNISSNITDWTIY